MDNIIEDTKLHIEKVIAQQMEEQSIINLAFKDDLKNYINSCEVSIAEKIWDKMKNITQQIDSILQNKQREKSDLQLMNSKLVAGVEHLTG